MKNLVLLSALVVVFATASYAEKPIKNDGLNHYRWVIHNEFKKQHRENEVLDRYPYGDSTENF